MGIKDKLKEEYLEIEKKAQKVLDGEQADAEEELREELEDMEEDEELKEEEKEVEKIVEEAEKDD